MIDAATRKFITETPLTSLLPISAGLLDACTAKAYALCATQAYANAEVISRGLVAAEPANWYYRTLLAVCLHKLHRRHEAHAGRWRSACASSPPTPSCCRCGPRSRRRRRRADLRQAQLQATPRDLQLLGRAVEVAAAGLELARAARRRGCRWPCGCRGGAPSARTASSWGSAGRPRPRRASSGSPAGPAADPWTGSPSCPAPAAAPRPAGVPPAGSGSATGAAWRPSPAARAAGARASISCSTRSSIRARASPRLEMTICRTAFRSARTLPGPAAHGQPSHLRGRQPGLALGILVAGPQPIQLADGRQLAAQEVQQQRPEVLAPVAQRRQHDLEARQPVEQRLEERPIGHLPPPGRRRWPRPPARPPGARACRPPACTSPVSSTRSSIGCSPARRQPHLVHEQRAARRRRRSSPRAPRRRR